VQMMSGLATMTGTSEKPQRVGSSANDIMGGMFGVISILAALFWMAPAERLTESILPSCSIASVTRSSAVASSDSPVRTDAAIQGMTAVQAYDGSGGWKIFPFQGRKDPEKMSADDCKSLVEDAEIGGPLEDWKAGGKTLTYLGTEDVEGTPAHKLRVVRKNGDVSYVYLDPDYFLEIRTVSQRVEQGAKVEVETDLGDYEKINGVYFPFSIESGPKGSTDKQKIVLDKAEANIPIDDSIFRFPTAAAK